MKKIIYFILGNTPHKIITTVPKLGASGTGGTQFIVVSTRPGGQHTGSVVTTLAGSSRFLLIPK